MSQAKAERLITNCRKEKKSNMAILFSIILFIGVMVCFICDLAISHHLTWSLIPAASIVFAWVTAFPVILSGKRGIAKSCISLSIFIIPYLYILSCLLKVKAVFSIGTATAIVSILFLWIIFAIFSFIGKRKRYTAWGISFLSAIPFMLIINLILSKMIGGPAVDMWDLLSVFVLLVSALVSFACDSVGKRLP